MFFHVTFFSLLTFDPCRGNENKLSYHFWLIVAFFRNICARSRKVTLKIASPIRRKNIFLFEYRKMDSFRIIFSIQLFSKVLYMEMLLCSSLKFSICDIYNMFLWYIQYVLRNSYKSSYTDFIFILSKFYPVRSLQIKK